MMQKTTDILKTLKILVVDDSEFSRKTIINMLETEGFNIVGEAGSAQEATEILSNRSANLLIVDVVMPDVSGIDLAKHLREHFHNIYVIMISSLAQEHIIIEAISAGASDFLHKPFSREDLISSVYKVGEGIKEEESL